MMVVTPDAALIFLTTPLPQSATYTLPSVSTATSVGIEKLLLWPSTIGGTGDGGGVRGEGLRGGGGDGLGGREGGNGLRGGGGGGGDGRGGGGGDRLGGGCAVASTAKEKKLNKRAVVKRLVLLQNNSAFRVYKCHRASWQRTSQK